MLTRYATWVHACAISFSRACTSEKTNGAYAHYVMVSKIPWKLFWLATQLYPENTLMLLLFASTKICEFEVPMILRVLIFAISPSRAKFCDFAQPRYKLNFKIHFLSNVAEPRLNLLQCSLRVNLRETCQMVQRAPVIR